MELQTINKKWWLFGATILAQLILMLFWVLNSNDIINNGTVYKFKLRGYDPYDPYRGKYLRFQFQDNSLYIPSEEADMLKEEKDIYASFSVDNNGFARPESLSKSISETALKVEMSHYNKYTDKVNIIYPFDKLWMNQEECPVVEKIVFKALSQNKDVYALVAIKNGNGVLLDIEIDQISLKTLVKEELNSEVYDANEIEVLEVAVTDEAELDKDTIKGTVDDIESVDSTEVSK